MARPLKLWADRRRPSRSFPRTVPEVWRGLPVIALCACPIIVSACTKPAPPARVSTTRGAPRVTAIDRAVMRAIDRGDLKGVAVAVRRGDVLLHAGGYGAADVARGIPVDVDSVFRFASISKVFTAALALKLDDDGILPLGTPLVEAPP